MPTTPSTSKVASSSSSASKPSAKSTILGGASNASKTKASNTHPILKHEKPLGMEGSDDEDLTVELGDDDDEVFEDATNPPTSSNVNQEDDDELMISSNPASKPSSSSSSANPVQLDPSLKPNFAPLSKNSASAQSIAQQDVTKGQLRRIPIPPHRMTPLKNDWHKIYTPLVEMAGLMVRMNVQRRMVEIKSSKHTTETGMLQKGADFVKAFALGFDADDAIALLRMDDLFVDTFEIKDVKTLHGDHLSRAIGRIAGKDGRTRFAIENASRTRVVLADTKIHILGSFQNIKIARDACVNLIMGSPPGKVYANLKTIGARQRQRA
ncbi:hypothetical protein IE53DRAFT_210191 [Violaceomyces palustris]|uniref:Uncharacterized protein n=1 Tax=Violaceomyces palustris TaxID=1673888 RepID=A0ACD0NQW0_9BASI|nr:hypothetical protein IE53DRAFT_210191 [Violaceomyces palustris]